MQSLTLKKNSNIIVNSPRVYCQLATAKKSNNSFTNLVLACNTVTKAPGRAVATAGINSNVDVCEKAKHHTELFW